MTVQSTVTSKEIGTPVTTATPRAPHLWPVGVLLLAFGIPLWLAGARYTVDGWMLGLNWFFTWLNIPVTIPRLDWRLYLLLIAVLGVAYSRVEVRHVPLRRTKDRIIAATPAIWIAFGLAILTDYGSTLLGVVQPPNDAWPLTRWAADVLPIAGVWTAILTFLPEWLLIWGWRMVWR